ncbi:MAG: tRNA pseudouridine(38-40) synthase TruA [Gemmatimonadota bacterium]
MRQALPSAAMVEGDSRRIAFTVQYDGGPYFGWQLQRNRRSVQGELEAALARLFVRPARVLGSGRTDRGVHATGQVASVDAPIQWEPRELKRAMNALLPPEVRVAHANDVAPGFHPRYAATARSYVYRIGVAAATTSPFHSRWCWALQRELDADAMARASEDVVGDLSFRAFAKAGQEHRGDRCIVTSAHWERWDTMGLAFHVTANRFLHHMVRYLVGTFVEVGLGRRPGEDVARLLNGEGGVVTSPPAPAHGLFLASVSYPPDAYREPRDDLLESLPPKIV